MHDDMANISLSLPNITASDTNLDSLPDVHPFFLVPKLADKPQNPIMETLRIRADSKQHTLAPIQANVEGDPEENHQSYNYITTQCVEILRDDILWHQAASSNSASRVSCSYILLVFG